MNNLFQAALDVRAIEKHGKYISQFRGYLEWFYNSPEYFGPTDLTLSSGNTLSITVNATSPTTGIVSLENLSTGPSRSRVFHEPNYPLIGRVAEWIVEEFPGDKEVPSNSSFEFRSTKVYTANGQVFDASLGYLAQVYDNRLKARFEGSNVKVTT